MDNETRIKEEFGDKEVIGFVGFGTWGKTAQTCAESEVQDGDRYLKINNVKLYPVGPLTDGVGEFFVDGKRKELDGFEFLTI